MMLPMTRLALLVVALGGTALAERVVAGAPTASPRTAVTHHAIVVQGTPVRYDATVREFPVKDTAGRSGAFIVTIAYTRTGVGDRARRPVLFAFNGGPGASSSPLHMKALGPVVRVHATPDDRADARLLDNAFSVLDVADLVFIDPVSTGFSRALPDVDPRQWYDSRFDATTVADVISQWLRANKRESSPRYVVGESYGTIRAGLIVRYAPKLRLDGVLLVSPPGSLSDAPSDARFAGTVASMAAGAWYHERVDRRGLDSAGFFREAMAFARGPYTQALTRGAQLSSDEQRHIAEQLSAFIGLPVDLILEHGLRIDANTYMFNLLKDRVLRTGRLDLRVTGPLLPGQEGAIDDPALGVVKPNTTGAPPPTPASLGAIESPIVGRYLVERLDFPSTVPYIGVNFLANSQWKFQPDDGTEQILANEMASRPRLRLFVTAGFFDFGAMDGRSYVDAGVPTDRFTFLPLPGPHEVYDGEKNRAAFNLAVRDFVIAGR